MIEISSTANTQIKEIKKLQTRKERVETGQAYIEGLRIVIEAFEAGMDIQRLIFCPSLLVSQAGRKLVDTFSADSPENMISVTESVFRHLSSKDGPQGLAAVIKQKWSRLEMLEPKPGQLIIALDEVADPGNLGTIIRTADAGGADTIILLDNCTDPYDPTSIRASMGALFDVSIIRCTFEDFVMWKKRNKVTVIGAAGSAETDYHFAKYPEKMVLMMGSERQGLSPRYMEISDQLVSIPMKGRGDSLNLAIATGIMIYEILNHRRDYKKPNGG